ncbi:NUDIX hydrolase, partial [Candidatus Falkowbacteria bacterium CG10_big_fil_rev_8_21_14_0_10_37_6]
MIEGVTFVLRNSANQFLLQLRDGNTTRHPHKWCFFGGSIELGESQAQALKREVFEELAYEMLNPRLLAKIVLTDKEKGEVVYNIFADNYDETQKLVLGEG